MNRWIATWGLIGLLVGCFTAWLSVWNVITADYEDARYYAVASVFSWVVFYLAAAGTER